MKQQFSKNIRHFEDGTKIQTMIKETRALSTVRVEAGCRGEHAYFSIKNNSETNMDARVFHDRFGDCKGFEVSVEGFFSKETLKSALEFILAVLESNQLEVDD